MPPAKKPAAKPKPKPAAKQPVAKQPAAKQRPKTMPPSPKPAAEPRVAPKPAERRSKRTAAARTHDEAARDVALFDSLATLRDALADAVLLTAERLQETLDDAVRRGRMLPTDAQELADRLTSTGRRQVEDLIAEIDRRTGGSK